MRIHSYDIYVDFNFKELTYNGTETISLETDGEIELDASGVEVSKVVVEGKEIPFETSDNKVKIKTTKISGNIIVNFSGKVKESLVGIYKAPYNGTYMISTQFESSHAREFIPCVDHPAFKAKFKLTIAVDKGLQVISNMP